MPSSAKLRSCLPHLPKLAEYQHFPVTSPLLLYIITTRILLPRIHRKIHSYLVNLAFQSLLPNSLLSTPKKKHFFAREIRPVTTLRLHSAPRINVSRFVSLSALPTSINSTTAAPQSTTMQTSYRYNDTMGRMRHGCCAVQNADSLLPVAIPTFLLSLRTQIVQRTPIDIS